MEYSYTTRHKLFKDYFELHQPMNPLFGKENRMLFKEICPANYGSARENINNAIDKMKKSKMSPEEYMKANHKMLVKFCVPEDLIDGYYAILKGMNRYPYSGGLYRRTVRTKGYEPVMGKVFDLLQDYCMLKFFECSAEEYLKNEMSEERLDFKYNLPYYCELSNLDYIIAGDIDNKRGDMIKTVQDILLSENNTGIVSTALIRGIIKSSDSRLHKLLGDFLVAARLQEGVRQAICENMDCGTVEAFNTLFQVIYDNNLIRYSSVKRAVGTWIGIMDYDSTERIMKKVLQTMHQCIFIGGETEKCLKSQDAIEIMTGLWRKGSLEVFDAVEVMRSYLESGSRQQQLVMSYYNMGLSYSAFYREMSAAVVSRHPDDMEMMAAFLPTYLENADELVSDAVYAYGRRSGEKYEVKEIPVTRLFKDRGIAEKHFGILRTMLESMPVKKKCYDPFLFPWYSVEISRNELIKRLCVIAHALADEDKLDYASGLCMKIEAGERNLYLQLLLHNPSSQLQRQCLVKALSDRESFTRDTAFELLKDYAFSEEDYKVLQEMLRLKNDDVRKNVLYFLNQRDNAGVSCTVKELLSDKREEMRLAGLDMLLQMQKDKKKEPFSKTLCETAAKIPSPTDREQILIRQLTGAVSSDGEEGARLYSENDRIKFPPVKYEQKDYPLFPVTSKRLKELFQKLDDFIDLHKNMAAIGRDGTEYLLGNCRSGLPVAAGDREGEENVAFVSVWEEFYKNYIIDFPTLYAMFVSTFPRPNIDSQEKGQLWDKYYEELLGAAVWKMDIGKYHYGPEYINSINGLFYGILNYLFKRHYDGQFARSISTKTCRFIAAGVPLGILWLKNKNAEENGYVSYYGGEQYDCFANQYLILTLCDAVRNKWENNVQWEERFYLLQAVDAACDFHNDKYNVGACYWQDDKSWLTPIDYVKEYHCGRLTQAQVYRAFFEDYSLTAVLQDLGIILQDKIYKAQEIKLKKYALLREEPEFDGDLFRKTEEIITVITEKVLDAECNRGDTPTEFTSAVNSIRAVYGIRWLIKILQALGDDKLDRGITYYWSSITAKNSCLSHLLQVCHPGREETAAELGAAIKEGKIKEKRLIEVCMYAPQWLDMLEEYLGYEGLKCGSYYFMAHMDDCFDDKKQAMIAKYTPLTVEELRKGAFDVDWFREAYRLLGEKRFGLLYDSAKYISDGSKHSRARKYADAALGKVNVKELMDIIESKRNKDQLMSLGLIPVRDKQDLLARYEYIQKFQKESRQFGAQRRASEAEACTMALKNLSIGAGYRDVTRLTLALEMELIESISSRFEWYALDDVMQIKLEVSKEGKPEISCCKNGKILASLPSAYKKHEYVTELKEIHKKLKEQYSRAVKMFELAMEERELYTLQELMELRKNPVILPIVGNLVFTSVSGKVSCGLISESGFAAQGGELISKDGKLQLRVAHPYDLYSSGEWHSIQKLFFRLQKEEGRKQPFRQVFRELYVKLEEELQQLNSRMFAGNQIQPRKTAACLKSRRWIADYEEGLQKIYYKDNIIARIYALADWFSPSDIEAPTLEWVEFSDRKTFRPVPVKNVPEILYSEVMRDVDLAVSVAHAGGVDPETSHSTVEMRRAVTELNLELFGLANVRLEGSHAFITGSRAEYTVHLGSGVIHKMGGHQINVLPVHSQSRGRIFLPFLDEDPKTAEIISKIILFGEDKKIKDPYILNQL